MFDDQKKRMNKQNLVINESHITILNYGMGLYRNWKHEFQIVYHIYQALSSSVSCCGDDSGVDGLSTHVSDAPIFHRRLGFGSSGTTGMKILDHLITVKLLKRFKLSKILNNNNHLCEYIFQDL